MKHLYILLIATALLSSCKNEVSTSNENQKSNPVGSNDPHIQSTQKLLQGSWINLDEKGVKVIFENNTRIEQIAGNKKGKTRYFQISDGCMGDIAGSKQLAKAKAKFISLQDIDMCFYILKLDRDYMNLKVVGRGNIIRYKREGSTSRINTDKAINQLKTVE